MRSQADIPRVAFVTGAARGIGAATVRRLVSLGYHVAAVDWCLGDTPPVAIDYAAGRYEDLQAVASGNGEAILPLVADVRSRSSVANAVAETVDAFGGIDVVIAAAANGSVVCADGGFGL